MAGYAPPVLDTTPGKQSNYYATDALTTPDGSPYGATSGPAYSSPKGVAHWGQTPEQAAKDFTDAHTTGYDFGGNDTAIYTDQSNGRIYFGNGQNFTTKDANGNPRPTGAGGYIDPTTGDIHYGAGSAPYTNGVVQDDSQAAAAPTGGTIKAYYYNQDYGLGPTALGIIPLHRNTAGQADKFYAGTANGGGQLFGTLEEAQSAVAAYKTWYDSQHPAGSSGTQIAPVTGNGGASGGGGNAAPATPTPPYNDLSLPGASETNWNETKDLYRQKTNAQKLADSLGPMGTTNAQTVFDETPNQPSAQENQWNKYSGIYGDPHYLDDYYARQERAAQTTLDRKAASGGWGDSGAAAKATGNLGAVFADRAITGMGEFAKTGMGLAGASDNGFTQRTTLRGNLASGADTSNNNQITTRSGVAQGADAANTALLTAGQAGAHSAQNDQQGRIGGGITALTQLGNDQAALVSAGFSAADAELFSTQLAGMEGQWTAAGLTAQQQYQKAQELMQSLGLASNTAVNYYLSTKYGAKK